MAEPGTVVFNPCTSPKAMVYMQPFLFQNQRWRRNQIIWHFQNSCESMLGNQNHWSWRWLCIPALTLRTSNEISGRLQDGNSPSRGLLNFVDEIFIRSSRNLFISNRSRLMYSVWLSIPQTHKYGVEECCLIWSLDLGVLPKKEAKAVCTHSASFKDGKKWNVQQTSINCALQFSNFCWPGCITFWSNKDMGMHCCRPNKHLWTWEKSLGRFQCSHALLHLSHR